MQITSQRPADPQPHNPNEIHPHPIRWDVDRQLWVCSPELCDFTRPKRPGEVVPTRDEARAEAMRAGTGADFADLRVRRAPSEQQPTAGESPPPTQA